MVLTKNNFPLLRMVFSFPAMLISMLLAVVWMLASGKANDPDIWWHLRNAEYLVQTHQFPNQDMYSFTIPGHPWINHEWLGELPYYFAWRIHNLAGVTFLWIALVELIFIGLLYLSWRVSRNIKAAILGSGFCAFLAVVSF